jgi:hypothetical protein
MYPQYEEEMENGGGGVGRTVHNYRRIRNKFNGECKKVQHKNNGNGYNGGYGVSPPKSAPLPRKVFPAQTATSIAGEFNNLLVSASSVNDLRFVLPPPPPHPPPQESELHDSNWSMNNYRGNKHPQHHPNVVAGGDYSELRTIVRRIEREQQRLNNTRNVDQQLAAVSSSSSSGSLPKKSPRFCRKKLMLDYVNG